MSLVWLVARVSSLVEMKYSLSDVMDDERK